MLLIVKHSPQWNMKKFISFRCIEIERWIKYPFYCKNSFQLIIVNRKYFQHFFLPTDSKLNHFFETPHQKVFFGCLTRGVQYGKNGFMKDIWQSISWMEPKNPVETLIQIQKRINEFKQNFLKLNHHFFKLNSSFSDQFKQSENFQQFIYQFLEEYQNLLNNLKSINNDLAKSVQQVFSSLGEK